MSMIQINPGTLKGKKLLPPNIIVDSNLVTFESTENVDSDPQSYTVQVPEVRGNLNIIAPYRFRVSLDGVTWYLSVVVPHTGGVIPVTEIWVKFTQGDPVELIKHISHYTEGNSVGAMVTGVCV